MKKTLQHIELTNGVKIPKIAFGVGRIQPEMAENSTLTALSSGFDFIDSCISYGNQDYVGKGVQEYLQKSDKKRSELILTQKLGGFELGYDKVMTSFDESCKNYGTDYLDIMLIYYPRENNPYNFRYVIDAWRALEKLYKQNKVKVIGVSNFSIENLMKLLAYAEIKPMINQIELHPFYQQRHLTSFCKDNNIQVEAWSPLMYVVNENILKELGAKYNKSSAQIALRWSVQKGFIPICSSKIESEIKENLEIFDFEICEDDMQRIDSLDGGMHSIDNSIQPQLDTQGIINAIHNLKHNNSYTRKFKLFGLIPIFKEVKKSRRITKLYFLGIPFLKIDTKTDDMEG